MTFTLNELHKDLTLATAIPKTHWQQIQKAEATKRLERFIDENILVSNAMPIWFYDDDCKSLTRISSNDLNRIKNKKLIMKAVVLVMDVNQAKRNEF